MTGFVNDRVLSNEDVTGISILMEYRHRTVVLVSPDKVNPSPNLKKIAGTRGYGQGMAGAGTGTRSKVGVLIG